jgi:hypothetical protein
MSESPAMTFLTSLSIPQIWGKIGLGDFAQVGASSFLSTLSDSKNGD